MCTQKTGDNRRNMFSFLVGLESLSIAGEFARTRADTRTHTYTHTHTPVADFNFSPPQQTNFFIASDKNTEKKLAVRITDFPPNYKVGEEYNTRLHRDDNMSPVEKINSLNEYPYVGGKYLEKVWNKWKEVFLTHGPGLTLL